MLTEDQQKEVEQAIHQGYMVMGEKLCWARANMTSAEYKEFVLTRLGFRWRKAEYLTSIYRMCVLKLNIPKERLAKIKWGHLTEIISVVETDPEYWITRAETLTRAELHALAVPVISQRGKKLITRHCYSLSPEEEELHGLAFAHAREVAQSHDIAESRLLGYILFDYCATSAITQKEEYLTLYIQNLEYIFKKKIIVINGE